MLHLIAEGIIILLLIGVLMSASNLTDAIAELQAAVTAETAVDQSALTLLNGIPALIQAAVTAALGKGATPEQLAAFDTLTSTISMNANNLAAAVAANTPAPAPTP